MCVVVMFLFLSFSSCLELILPLFSFSFAKIFFMYLSLIFFPLTLRPARCLTTLFPTLSNIRDNRFVFSPGSLPLVGPRWSCHELAAASCCVPVVLAPSLTLRPLGASVSCALPRPLYGLSPSLCRTKSSRGFLRKAPGKSVFRVPAFLKIILCFRT